jgi:hypothetical protein
MFRVDAIQAVLCGRRQPRDLSRPDIRPGVYGLPYGQSQYVLQEPAARVFQYFDEYSDYPARNANQRIRDEEGNLREARNQLSLSKNLYQDDPSALPEVGLQALGSLQNAYGLPLTITDPIHENLTYTGLYALKCMYDGYCWPSYEQDHQVCPYRRQPGEQECRSLLQASQEGATTLVPHQHSLLNCSCRGGGCPPPSQLSVNTVPCCAHRSQPASCLRSSTVSIATVLQFWLQTN